VVIIADGPLVSLQLHTADRASLQVFEVMLVIQSRLIEQLVEVHLERLSLLLVDEILESRFLKLQQ
jgi:hypothetical protein